ncbi:metal-dependent hydrolase family protein [Pseudomonas panipatensis]|uniref:Imidazolonepropionase n=1 Tax=Pseudomonas panipatensis TaxID=428992 RepID=A0A1G8BHM5_9PSED|nr:amidohydrolase family protein [Pseudomonas panipatensis]SDH32564.1 Imidazolonepropionase [Pseudomonas panipatensis]SMP71119.1 Imidazolonepropionase [Pseudomonas panipatensis]
MSALHLHCQNLFDATGLEARADQTLIVENGLIRHLGPRHQAPRPQPGDQELRAEFVMPGLIDVHTHLAFGNAQSEEDIDIWTSDEFRALRGLFFAQHVLAAGVTSMVCPGDSGQLSIAVRNAVNAGLFEGPRIAASSRVITNRQSLNDWFPSRVGAPEYFTARLVTSRAEALAEIRTQAKDGVDLIKIAMDGTQRRPNGDIIAAFTLDETREMVEEAHRLGCKVATHAYGREAVMYAAKAGVDLVFHAFYMDDACIEALLQAGSILAPTMTFPQNTVDFCQPHDPAIATGYAGYCARTLELGTPVLKRAKAAGIPFACGSDSGFAVTPYGEWHARELELLVERLGFSPAEALYAATNVGARCMPRGESLGTLEVGKQADFLVLDGSPLEDIRLLQDRSRIQAVYKAGKPVRQERTRYNPKQVSDFNSLKWTDLYTRERVAELGKWSL